MPRVRPTIDPSESVSRRGRPLAWAAALLSALALGYHAINAFTPLGNPLDATLERALDANRSADAQPPACINCTHATVAPEQSTESASGIAATLIEPDPLRIALPASFNRSIALSTGHRPSDMQVWAAQPVTNADPPSWQIVFDWFVGQPRSNPPEDPVEAAAYEEKRKLREQNGSALRQVDRIRVPNAGYLSAVLPAGNGAPIPVGTFGRGGHGYIYEELYDDSADPFQFTIALFQPVPRIVTVAIAPENAADLKPGEQVELSAGQHAVPTPLPAGEIIAIRPHSDGARVDLTIELSAEQRQRWQDLRLATEVATLRRLTTVDLRLLRGSTQRNYAWLPSAAVQNGAEPNTGRVWAIIDRFAVPISVYIGQREAKRIAIVVRVPAGLAVPVDYQDWRQLNPVQRRSVLQALGPRVGGQHAPLAVIAAPQSNLTAGAAAQTGVQP